MLKAFVEVGLAVLLPFGDGAAFDLAVVLPDGRILRNAPAGAPTSGFGNPGAVAFDMKREEILVPN